MMLTCSTVGEVNLDHLVDLLSAGFLYVQS